ncbi:MAG: nitroreductase family protein [Lachnospiraceae bacterium]
MIKDMVYKSRSYRRFYEERPITMEQLEQLADLGRLSPSGGNKQYIRYALVCEPEMNKQVFHCLGWAGYLSDWDGPKEGERPAGYIILLRDTELNANVSVDEGIAAQSIFLGATEMGLGGCYIMNCNREKLSEVLKLEDQFAISMVIALGVPKEEVLIEDLQQDGDYKYWRDENQVHHVPKRLLADVIVKKF